MVDDKLKGINMKRILDCWIALMLIFTTNCAALVAGAGTGAGVYTYISGELKRVYPTPLDETAQACATSLEDLKITLDNTQTDSGKTIIKAKKSDGTPIVVKASKIDPTNTEVSVRSGMLGVWDKEVSELIHATIAKKLL